MRTAREILGVPKQTGYVVEDLDAAVDFWTTTLGVGPFYVADGFEIEDFRHRGRPAPITMRLALGSYGPLQVELIELVSDGPSDFHDFRELHGSGLHHLGFWTDDFSRDDAALRELGFVEVHAGKTPGIGEPFVYFDATVHPGTVIELSQADGAKGVMFADIARAARDWDGRDPVRPLRDAMARATETCRAGRATS
ncbi:MAG: VOC family protein [Pseudonocardia sp.]|uniref:VOC family protein n=1 Tax=unclassified Pseudonocardia TaxID=2619320 RepID=UPI00086A58B6|nr:MULTISPECIES: VOC family protein [unclassified Pseudonocardia]MBN9111663.1 VOC family protein [Pseudonocardia sp.]ODU26436.1 MAG: hypothetical protein ABS80_06865 [Pseudonocardia sp. SCN 72-51]ODV02257.1 MAG: hypothetical protein ABT15_25565 [Pseudonocardia sp. SCN 73-27]